MMVHLPSQTRYRTVSAFASPSKYFRELLSMVWLRGRLHPAMVLPFQAHANTSFRFCRCKYRWRQLCHSPIFRAGGCRDGLVQDTKGISTAQPGRAGLRRRHGLQPVCRPGPVCRNRVCLRQGGSSHQDSGHQSDRGHQRYVQRRTGRIQSLNEFRDLSHPPNWREHRPRTSGDPERHADQQRSFPGVTVTCPLGPSLPGRRNAGIPASLP